MSAQDGHNGIGKEDNNKNDFYELLSENGTEGAYKSVFDYISKVSKELREKQSFYTFNLADVLLKVQLWKRRMPDIRPFYAVKTNSDPVLLRFLVLLGFSFDCATEGEIRLVLEAGGDPKNIIFAHVIKPRTSLEYACLVGVDLMTFDSEEELLKIHKYYPESRLVLRLIPEEVKCSYDLSDKFGCDAEDTMKVLSLAKDLSLNVVGVSFHVGGLCKNPNSYAATILTCRKVFDIGSSLGFKFTTLDIGGGFSGSKGSEGLFCEISRVIKKALKENFNEPGIEIIAEPGTFFSCSAVTLTTAICGKKIRNNHQKEINEISPIQRFYYLNDSIYGSFFLGTEHYGSRLQPLLAETELRQRPIYNSKVWGQTCCGEDLLLKECLLPDLHEGEFLVWENMGAYNQVLCSTFCGVPLPASRHIFVNNPRLSLTGVSNLNEVLAFIGKECSLVEKE